MNNILKENGKKIINPKDDVLKTFNEAIQDEDSLEIYDVDEKNNTIGYFDEENGYERTYYFNDTKETIASRIIMDEQVEKFLDKDALATFLFDNLDHNSLMVMENLVFTFDTEIDFSNVRNELEEKYGDEYAMYVGEDTLGVTWVERQTPLINISNLVESSVRIANEPDEYLSVDYIFTEGLLQTIFHECRHLFYECNEIVPDGDGTPYPKEGGREHYVEMYGNDMAEKYISEFNTKCIKPGLSNVMDEMIGRLGLDRDVEYYEK